MRIVLFGAAGFIGTNLALELSKEKENEIVIVNRKSGFANCFHEKENIIFIDKNLDDETDYKTLTKGCNVVYHLLSTTVPTTSNQKISQELSANMLLSTKMFEACASNNVEKVIFFSSGGAVYGKDVNCPLNEDTPVNPITSYGIQKIAIEKLLYLYSYLYGFDYRIIRLSNPYGPYQRPNGILGAVSTFTYKALKGEKIQVYGDGSVVRDYIYIDDAIRGVLSIAYGNDSHRVFNLGCGYGTSINKVLNTIKNVLRIELDVEYTQSRAVDVPINYLDISRYEKAYGKLNTISLEEGIRKTAVFMKKYYDIKTEL